MITLDEKKQFIEKILDSSDKPEKSKELQDKLYKLLMDETSNGKLYKYRTFDKDGYALDNLKNNTLHCSYASSFNDPFDCKVGITLESLHRDKYENEICLIGCILDKFMSILQGEIHLSSCAAEEQRIIKKLLDIDEFTSLINLYKGRCLSDNEKSNILYRNANVIVKILQCILEDESFVSELQVTSSMLPLIMDKITASGMLTISEENSSFTDFAHASGISNDSDEMGLMSVMFANVSPEIIPAIAKITDIYNRVEQSIDKLFIIGCLCTDYKSRLMWSHYADSHRGFCVEYDYSNLDEKICNEIPYPVMYSNERPLMSCKAIFNNTHENRKILNNQIIKGLMTKDSVWSYENEWRIITKQPSQNIIMPRVSCVYLGAAISDKNKEEILRIARQNNYSVKQMVLDRGTYDLHVKETLV